MTGQTFSKLKQKVEADRKRSRPLYSSFGALGDSTRYVIFNVLVQHEGFCVSDVARIVGISVPATSQQLKCLELSNLVIRKRSGRKICYEVNVRNAIAQSLTHLMQS